MDYREVEDKEEWDGLVDKYGGHPLQYWGWGEFKAGSSWGVVRVDLGEGGAQVLIKPLPLGQKMFFVPRGPFGFSTLEEKLLKGLSEFARKKRATILKIEPEWKWNMEDDRALNFMKFHKSENQVFLARTAEVRLEGLEEMLASFSKKTRQYINKSARELSISQIEHSDMGIIGQIFEIYKETAGRAGFSIHPKEYYFDLAKIMGEKNRIFGAFHEGELVAFLWNIASKRTEFELYGGTNEVGQRMKANYGLKWKAISRAHENGVELYDMNGLLNDGISEFKRHFIMENDEIERTGTWDYYPSPVGKMMDGAMGFVRKVKRRK